MTVVGLSSTLHEYPLLISHVQLRSLRCRWFLNQLYSPNWCDYCIFSGKIRNTYEYSQRQKQEKNYNIYILEENLNNNLDCTNIHILTA